MAELKRRLHGRDQFLYAFSSLQFNFGLRNVAYIRAEVVVAVHDMCGEMAKCHLVSRRLVIKLVGRHFFKGGDRVLLAACEHLAENIGNWGLSLLRQCGGGNKNNADHEDTFHGASNYSHRRINVIGVRVYTAISGVASSRVLV